MRRAFDAALDIGATVQQLSNILSRYNAKKFSAINDATTFDHVHFDLVMLTLAPAAENDTAQIKSIW